MARKIENLKIYKLSYNFVLDVYEILKYLPKTESKNIFSQLQRASTSIVLNIAEGASNKSNKVFLNHLQYSYGSCKEVKVLLMLARDLKYVEETFCNHLLKSLDHLTASVFRFMNSVQKEIDYGRRNYSLNFN